MKKFLFGVLMSTIGMVYSFFCFSYAVVNPCVCEGRSGLLVSLAENYVLVPFLISTCFLLIGLMICGYNACISKL